MSAIKIKLSQFSGTGKVFSRESNGLAAILRGLAIDMARFRVEVAAVHSFTDNSGGTHASALVAMPLPVTAIDATTTGGAQLTALNASLVKIQNAGLVITNTLNEARTILGLPSVTSAAGTQAVADTIPAQDLTGTAGNGNAAAEFYSTIASFKVAKDNFARLMNGADEVLVAMGVAPLSEAVPGSHALDEGLLAIPAAVAVATGPGAVALADVSAFLTASANNIASLAFAWNAAMNQGGGSGTGPLNVVAG
jgi:hypothetical protein